MFIAAANRMAEILQPVPVPFLATASYWWSTSWTGWSTHVGDVTIFNGTWSLVPICWQWLHTHWLCQATALQDLLGCALHPWFPLTWRLCAQRTLGSMGPPSSEWRYWYACWFAERQWICWLKLHRISCPPHSGERCAKLLDTQCALLFGYKISLCGEPLIWRTACPPLRLNFQSLYLLVHFIGDPGLDLLPQGILVNEIAGSTIAIVASMISSSVPLLGSECVPMCSSTSSLEA